MPPEALFILLPPGIIFAIGFFIGRAAFKNSPKRVAYSVLSGFTALFVTVGIIFAGCIVLLSNNTNWK